MGETKEEKEAKFAGKLKAEIAKLGTGNDAKIEVKLKDGSKIKGYVSEANNNSFVVVNEKTGESSEIPYPNAKQVKGNNLTTGKQIAIFIGIFLAIVFIIGATAKD